MRNWTPTEIIVGALASAICFMLITTSLNGFIKGVQLSNEKSAMIENIVVTVLNIVALFVGAKIQEKKDLNN